MNRRDFVRTTAAGAALAAAAPTAFSAVKAPAPAAQKLIKPPRLRAGDTVGIVLPASAEFETPKAWDAKFSVLAQCWSVYGSSAR